MNRKVFAKDSKCRLVNALVLLSLLLTLPAARAIPPTVANRDVTHVIVQGAPGSALASIVTRYGGVVTRDLGVINAVAATVQTHQVDALARVPGVSRVWPDEMVQSADSADPGMTFAPITGVETRPESFDLNKVKTLDGKCDPLDNIPLNTLNPHLFQAYTFRPEGNPDSLPAAVALRFVFKEKNLGQAQLQVYQVSTRTWHTFEIDTLSSNDKFIDTTWDLSAILQTAEDLEHVEVRFRAARNDGGEKAEVDLVSLHVAGTAYAPVAGAETKLAGFDLKKVATLNGDTDNMDFIPRNTLNPYVYQAYTFQPSFDPDDLPGLIDLRLVFKEKSLNQAQLQIFQASTRAWHTFDIETLSTNDRFIDTTIDLSDVLTSAEDFQRVEVRLLVSRNEGGEKAEIDLVSLRLAALVGDTALDVSAMFEALNAAPVWASGNTGAGVGIAVLDSGSKKYRELERDIWGHRGRYMKGWSALTGKDGGDKDKNGHGTLVASLVGNNKSNGANRYYGIAPNSHIIPVQVLNTEGMGSYSQVIAGVDWVIRHKDVYNIRVLNISLSATPRSYYWDDPLNQAVMRAWQAGIVVVAAAGNRGPDPMTIGVPANNPYVITVGAISDAYTPGDWSDDYIPAFSAAGPTYEGFVKPDLLAPGTHVVGLLSDKSRMAKEHPNHKIDKDYYKFSGTSMSAAQVSGIVALMLARHPELTPDQVKYRLMASARPALKPDGTLAFSLWQQGAGRVDAYAATYGAYTGEANQGLDIGKDLAGTEHYVGQTRWDAENMRFYLPGEDSYTWSGGFAWSEGYIWGGGFAWSESYVWGGGFAWSESYTWGEGFAWSESFVLDSGFAWSEAVASIEMHLTDE